MYEEVKVWKHHYNGSRDAQFILYESHGMAVDKCREYLGRAEYPTEDTIMFNDDIVPGIDDVMYRVGTYIHGYTNWYQSEREARDHLTKALEYAVEEQGSDILMVQRAILNTEHYPEDPARHHVFFHKNDDGDYCCRIHVNADWFGKSGPGKIFFADWRFASVQEGPATVSITSDKGSYGFVKGTMDKMGKDIDDIALATYLRDSHKFDDTYDLYRVDSPVRGTYYVASTGDLLRGVMFQENIKEFYIDRTTHSVASREADGVTISTLDVDLDYMVKLNLPVFIARTLLGSDLYEKLLSPDGMSTMYEKVNGLVEMLYTTRLPAAMEKINPSLFYDAIEYGFIKGYYYPSRPDLMVFTWNDQSSLNDGMVYFNNEELQIIFDTCRNINEATDAAMLKSIQNGKLRINSKCGMRRMYG